MCSVAGIVIASAIVGTAVIAIGSLLTQKVGLGSLLGSKCGHLLDQLLEEVIRCRGRGLTWGKGLTEGGRIMPEGLKVIHATIMLSNSIDSWVGLGDKIGGYIVIVCLQFSEAAIVMCF